jgi:hypothetical protein
MSRSEQGSQEEEEKGSQVSQRDRPKLAREDVTLRNVFEQERVTQVIRRERQHLICLVSHAIYSKEEKIN